MSLSEIYKTLHKIDKRLTTIENDNLWVKRLLLALILIVLSVEFAHVPYAIGSFLW